DMSRDASNADIGREVSRMRLGRLSALTTKWTLRMLRRRAYTIGHFREVAAASPLGTCDIQAGGIGLDVRFKELLGSNVVLPGSVAELVGRYLRRVDLAIPGAIQGFYVVGSTALGAFRPGRSDVDFVAVLGEQLAAADLNRLRRAHHRLYSADLAHAFLRLPWR